MAIPSTKDIKYWLFLAVFVMVIVMFIRLLIPFIAPLILSAIVVSIFTPVYYFINRWLPKSAASLVCCVLICVVIFIPFVIIITILANQALGLYASAMNSTFMQNLIREIDGNTIVVWVNTILDRLGMDFTISGEEIYRFIGRIGSRFGSFLYAQAANITGNFIKLIINFCFMILISYYLFGNGRRVINFFVGLSPLPEGHEVAVLQRLKTTAGAIFFGSFVSGVIQGTVGGITLWLFGFPAPFLWAVVMVILAFLPIVGIGLVFVPCIVITFVGGEIVSAIIMTVIYIASSSITEYIIVPRLEGKRSQMHTVLVFLSVLGGLQLFGIIGVLYGPLIITAFLALYEIYRANYVDAMEMEVCPEGAVTVTPAPANTEIDLTAKPAHKTAQAPSADKARAMADDSVGACSNAEEDVFAGYPPPESPRGGDNLPSHFSERIEKALVEDTGVVGEDVFDNIPDITKSEMSEANNIAMGDDTESEFNETSSELLRNADITTTGAFTAKSAKYDAVGSKIEPDDLQPESGTFADDNVSPDVTDYPGGTPPPACHQEDEAGEDGLIWDVARPAHLPFPKAEGAEKLIHEDSDVNPDVSIKDIVRADITSFDRVNENISEDHSSDDKVTKE